MNWSKQTPESKTALLSVVLLVTLFLYFAVISVGKFNSVWPIHMLFYDQLADGLRHGHLYLPNGPDPRLVALKDPYNPIHMHLWNLDATYYKGRYYIYWGPFPAILQAIGKELLGIHRIIGDQYLVFFFFSLMAVFGALLILRIAHRLAVGIPPWLVAAATLGMGLANPVTFLLSSGGVYQAAIAGSQAFLFLGVIFAFDAIWESKHSLRRVVQLVLAGVAWSMAIGCRISVVMAVAPIILGTIVCTSVTESLRFRRFIRDGLWVSAPIALTIFALLYYNKVRFDEWLEFGVKYQLSAFPFRSANSYILPNVDSYFLRLPDLSCRFPYIYATTENGAGPITNLIGLPKNYLIREPTIGMLYVVPLVYAAPIAIIAAVRRLRSGLFLGAESPFAAESRQRRAYVWFVSSMLFAAVGPAIIPVSIYFATMRYLSDFTNAIVLLAILGLFAWWGKPAPLKLHRRLRFGFTIATISVTAVVGLLLGYQGYMPYFKRYNPSLHAVLEPALSFCDHR